MAAEELKRLKDDLSTMRQAMKLDKPYVQRTSRCICSWPWAAWL